MLAQLRLWVYNAEIFSGGSSNLWKPVDFVAKQNSDFWFFWDTLMCTFFTQRPQSNDCGDIWVKMSYCKTQTLWCKCCAVGTNCQNFGLWIPFRAKLGSHLNLTPQLRNKLLVSSSTLQSENKMEKRSSSPDNLFHMAPFQGFWSRSS